MYVVFRQILNAVKQFTICTTFKMRFFHIEKTVLSMVIACRMWKTFFKGLYSEHDYKLNSVASKTLYVNCCRDLEKSKCYIEDTNANGVCCTDITESVPPPLNFV